MVWRILMVCCVLLWPASPRADDAATVIQSFSRINEQMQESLATPLTGDADQDFAASMIAHQRAATDMIQVLLNHGDDPELHALAQDMLRYQKRETHILKTWLEKNTR